jgi:hypothetical protein
MRGCVEGLVILKLLEIYVPKGLKDYLRPSESLVASHRGKAERLGIQTEYNIISEGIGMGDDDEVFETLTMIFSRFSLLNKTVKSKSRVI